ncbi:hypothetical protein Dda_5914 [Drechslerella dactyloides]|uniref:Formylmethionine deformylase-like protein n=1 Tax=Drechslerella dactyloides TaxID=74499 RepID=A0AAD6IUX0_DREDA|nr:hypothetical protein Dda_5914 [Drechslerella dactyloides]
MQQNLEYLPSTAAAAVDATTSDNRMEVNRVQQRPLRKIPEEYGYGNTGTVAQESGYSSAHVSEQLAPRKKSSGSVWGLAQMFGLFLAACGFGVGHHFYYSYLNGRVANNQSWYLAAGNAISYGARILFSASIGLCIRQWFWKAMRSESWTLGTIDKLHGVKDSPANLLSPRFAGTFVARAPLGLLITLFVWSLPAIPIIAPTSLSVHVVYQTFTDLPIQITNLDLTGPDTITTDPNEFKSQFAQPILFGAARGGYDTPSSRALGLVYNTFNGGQILSLPSPCNGNCTFNQTFYGPAFKCEEVTPENDSPWAGCYNKTADECGAGYASLHDPYVTTWYDAGVSVCNGTDGTDGIETCTALPSNARKIGDATYVGDGKLWIFYRWLPPDLRDPNRTTYDESIWENHRLVCQSYNASFNVHRTYLAGGLDQTVGGTVEYINPTNFSSRHVNFPESPGEVASYAIVDVLVYLLGGMIHQFAGPSIPTVIDETQLAGSRIVEAVPFPKPDGAFGIQKPVRDLARAIEELHFNVTVGMLSIQDLAWLKNETVPSTQYVGRNVWSYRWLTLAAVYGAFAAANVVALAVGLYAIVQNHGGFIKNDSFLRIMMTTRNPELDRLTESVSDGRGDDDEQELLEEKEVRFGYLVREPQGFNRHKKVGFGFPNSVVGLWK